MKPKIRTPYFEIGTKNYIYGDKVLEYALAADRAAEKYDIDVLFIVPAVEIRRVAENTKHLIVLAPYMDTLRPGRGMADVLPEGLKAAGAQGAAHNAFSRGLTHGGNAVALLGGLLHQAGEVVIRQRNMSIGIDLGDHLRSSFSGLAAAKPATALYEFLAIIHHFSLLEQGISEKFILARGFNIPFTKFTAQEYILFTEV